MLNERHSMDAIEEVFTRNGIQNLVVKDVSEGPNFVRYTIDASNARYDNVMKLLPELKEAIGTEDIVIWGPGLGSEYFRIDINRSRHHAVRSEGGWTMEDFRNILPIPFSIGRGEREKIIVCNMREISPMLVMGGDRDERNVFVDEIKKQVTHHKDTEHCHFEELAGGDICTKLKEILKRVWNSQEVKSWSALVVILKDVVADQELWELLDNKYKILGREHLSQESHDIIKRTYFIVTAKNTKSIPENAYPRTTIEFNTAKYSFLGWREFIYTHDGCELVRVQGFTPPKRKFTSKDSNDLQKYIHSPHATVKGYLALVDRYEAETTLQCTDCTLIAANADYIKRRMLIRTVKALACKYHKGQFRKGSEKVPYIKHPGSVVAKLKEWGVLEEELSLAVAWGHDLFEDTKITEEDMIKVFPEDPAMMERVISDIKQITFYPPKNASNQEYDEAKRKYIKDIAANAPEDVLLVKIADRLCNSLDFLKFSDKKAWEYIREGQPLFDNVERLSECYREEVKAEIAATFKQIDEEVARQDAYERMHDSMDWAGEE